MSDVILHLGDCLDVMAGMEPDSIDAIVTDPPYGLAFMGKDWDHGVPGIPFWETALRVAKPGAHLLAFGGTRTFHRLAVAIEDAGWEIRDTIMWVYGSGFPKSLDVSKAIDARVLTGRSNSTALSLSEKNRPVVGEVKRVVSAGRTSANVGDHGVPANMERFHNYEQKMIPVTVPATPEAARWAGWGTALKPAWEPIILARKPLRGTVAANVLAWGTGAINVDGCRVGIAGEQPRGSGARESWRAMEERTDIQPHGENVTPAAGRWPANLVHDGSDEVVELFPVSQVSGSAKNGKPATGVYPVGMFGVGDKQGPLHNDTGSAARFFHRAPFEADDFDAARLYYCAKASRADRDEGLEGLEEKPTKRYSDMLTNGPLPKQTPRRNDPQRNHHPTVKPTDLMRWLVRLVTRPGGVVLDPFCGSGSTGKAAALEGMQFIGIEQDAEYLEIARLRIAAVSLPLFVQTEATV